MTFIDLAGTLVVRNYLEDRVWAKECKVYHLLKIQTVVVLDQILEEGSNFHGEGYDILKDMIRKIVENKVKNL